MYHIIYTPDTLYGMERSVHYDTTRIFRGAFARISISYIDLVVFLLVCYLAIACYLIL